MSNACSNTSVTRQSGKTAPATITAASTLAEVWRLCKVRYVLCSSSRTGEWWSRARRWTSRRPTGTTHRAPSPQLGLCPAGCKTCSPAIGAAVKGSRRDTLEHSTTRVLLRIGWDSLGLFSPAPACSVKLKNLSYTPEHISVDTTPVKSTLSQTKHISKGGVLFSPASACSRLKT